jgi:hypothetical protein
VPTVEIPERLPTARIDSLINALVALRRTYMYADPDYLVDESGYDGNTDREEHVDMCVADPIIMAITPKLTVYVVEKLYAPGSDVIVIGYGVRQKSVLGWRIENEYFDRAIVQDLVDAQNRALAARRTGIRPEPEQQDDN